MQGEFEKVAVVCDDEQSFAILVGSVIEHFGYRTHVCITATEAIALANQHDLDLIVVDLDLGNGPTGIDVLRHIRRTAPWTAGVILTSHRSPKLVRKDLSPKLDGATYVVKSDLQSVQDLQSAIQAAIEGVSASLPPDGGLPRLTASQAHLLRMINDGLSNEEIARRSKRSLRAVQGMISRLYATLGIQDVPGVNARVIAVQLYRNGRVTTR